MENRVKQDNYIVLQGWMVADLKLKGNELVLYALIYGFSQAENQTFSGGLQYLADWTNSTKQGVIKSLKSLIEKGYIAKEEKYINGVKFCEYSSTKFNGVLNKVEQGIKQSLPNNKEDNQAKNIEDIVAHLNKKAQTKYQPSTPSTQRHIRARLNEGYTVDDFKKVIDKKCFEWKGTTMEKYLRPETLFGSKFEGYLNAKIVKEGKRAVIGDDLERREYTDEQLAKLINAFDD